jgi:hypothetical protein
MPLCSARALIATLQVRQGPLQEGELPLRRSELANLERRNEDTSGTENISLSSTCMQVPSSNDGPDPTGWLVQRGSGARPKGITVLGC